MSRSWFHHAGCGVSWVDGDRAHSQCPDCGTFLKVFMTEDTEASLDEKAKQALAMLAREDLQGLTT
jgi:hypothetical protein